MIRPGRLLILVLVIVATSATTCNPGECLSDTGHCCQCCSAGEHDTKLCQENHGAAECASCESGRTFMAHPNLQPLCSPCSDCRKEDQNPVSNCSLTSDRECQCAENYYCDSEKCVEHCFQCKRCDAGIPVLVECNATANTVCGMAHSKSRNWPMMIVCILPLLVSSVF
ncbi:tumor necrosis factor receptor superfamily member 26-like isoform X2 [Cavia porcellus]|uniref:tumor necrosis factor receptor superfamily member 26-like isoform X2 n=1 Tax=Cavia porcellus TaxID=10141 RepID=UPI000661AECF|nr:tumor necrosis factor receptor superfamily member 26-like [Cavia porcellus]